MTCAAHRLGFGIDRGISVDRNTGRRGYLDHARIREQAGLAPGLIHANGQVSPSTEDVFVATACHHGAVDHVPR